MRKFTLLISMFMLALGICAQTNLVQNPGFESWADGKPSSWVVPANSSHANAITISQETTVKTEGASSMKLAINDLQNPGFQQVIPIVAGKSYIVSIDCYVVAGDGSDTRIWSSFKNATGFYATANWTAAVAADPNIQKTLQPTGYTTAENGTWVKVSAEFKAPADATDFVFEFRTYKNATVIYDNASLIETGGSTTPSINVNSNSLSFSSVVGTPTAAQNITVSAANITAAPTVSITGTDAAMFSSTGTLTTSGGELSVVFTPTSSGSKSATLTVTSGAVSASVNLTGTASDASNPYGLDDSAPLNSLNEPFGTGTVVPLPTGWISYSVQGDRKWEVKTYSQNGYAQMSAHNGTGAYQTLLISPAINLNSVDKTNVKFDWNSGYANGATLKVYVMSKDGSKTEVKTINDDVNTAGYGTGFITETLNLSSYSGVKFLAFEYNGVAGSTTTTYQVDNVVATSTSGVSNTSLQQLNLWTSAGKINFNAAAGEMVEVYNTLGQRLYNAAATDGQNQVQVGLKGVAIVKVGNRVGKVIL